MTFIKRHIKHSLSDLQLIKKYQEDGAIHLIGDLYQRYLELVYGVCLKYLKDESDAKDASMEVFEILTKKLKTHPVENFRSWLYTVVKNHCLQILRKEKYKIQRLEDGEVMHSEDFMHHDSDFDLVEPHADLHSCMNELPEGQRKSIQWFYFEKKSYEEIAIIMELTKDQVRSHIQNGRRNLKNCLNDKSNGKG